MPINNEARMKKFKNKKERRRFIALDRVDFLSMGKTADPDFMLGNILRRFHKTKDIRGYINDHFIGEEHYKEEIYTIVTLWDDRRKMLENGRRNKKRAVADKIGSITDLQRRIILAQYRQVLKAFLRKSGLPPAEVHTFRQFDYASPEEPTIYVNDDWPKGTPNTVVINYNPTRALDGFTKPAFWTDAIILGMAMFQDDGEVRDVEKRSISDLKKLMEGGIRG